MKIKRPDWFEGPVYRERGEPYNLDKFWEEEIEPINKMLEAGVEVHGHKDHDGWGFDEQGVMSFTTHTALLINIQPIKKEMAEDVLRDIYKHQVDKWSYDKDEPMDNLLKRAKAVLDEG